MILEAKHSNISIAYSVFLHLQENVSDDIILFSL